MGPAPFLALPLELRLMIYGFLFRSPDSELTHQSQRQRLKTKVRRTSSPALRGAVSLTQTCRMVHDELALFFATPTRLPIYRFALRGDDDAQMFCQLRAEGRMLTHVRTMVVSLCLYERQCWCINSVRDYSPGLEVLCLEVLSVERGTSLISLRAFLRTLGDGPAHGQTERLFWRRIKGLICDEVNSYPSPREAPLDAKVWTLRFAFSPKDGHRRQRYFTNWPLVPMRTSSGIIHCWKVLVPPSSEPIQLSS